MVEGVPAEFAETPATRLQLYAAITARHEEEMTDPLCVTTASVGFKMPWNVLTRNAAYQRDEFLKKNKVARIVNNWRPAKFQSLRVAMIPVYDDNGTMIDVRFEVADGWHRRSALVQLQMTAGNTLFTISCEITPCRNQAEAASIFSASNNPDERAPTSSKEQWKAAFVEGQTDVVGVVELCDEYGLNARCTSRTRRWPYVDFGFAIRNAISDPRIGLEGMHRGLQIYGNAQLFGLRAPKLEHVPHALSAQMFIGVCRFIALFEMPGYAHDVVIQRMFADPSFLHRMRYHLETMSLEDIADAIGFSVSRHNEQHIRQWKITASLVRIYEEYVTKPRSSKQSLWPECPVELRTLFHSIRHEEDEQRRAQRVAQMHRTLVRMNLPPRFEVCVVRPITR
jgi:hypothetical protein